MNPRHDWTADDEERLVVAVHELKDVCPKGVKFWSAVVGRIAPHVPVSPEAARKRFETITRRRAVESQSADGWSVVAEQVNSFERDQWDHLFDRLHDLEETMQRLSRDMESLKRAWE